MNISASKEWKCDVAVVGGGAAGLSAAIRIRYVKEYEALPLSVVVFEPYKPGGLLNAGKRRMVTGPSHTASTGQILNDLKADVEKLEIPVVPHRISRIDRTDMGKFRLHFGDGGIAVATAVVMATGSRPLSNELDYFEEGVFITYKGLSFLSKIIDRAAAFAGDKPIAMITNRNVRALLPMLWKNPGDYLFLVPPGQEFELERLPGAVVAAVDWRITGRDEEAFTLKVQTPSNGELELWARSIVMDYVSFQNGPALPEFGFKLKESRPGIPKVDEFLQSSQEGLFLAGDVTCRYASVTSALADGIAAGFGAYGHAYQRLFGQSPPLFAYHAGRNPETFLERELPELDQDFRLEWLQTPPTGHSLANMDGLTLGEASARFHIPPERLYALVYQTIRDRMITVKPR